MSLLATQSFVFNSFNKPKPGMLREAILLNQNVVKFRGRVWVYDPSYIFKADWPATGIEFAFEAVEVWAWLEVDDVSYWFDVEIDCDTAQSYTYQINESSDVRVLLYKSESGLPEAHTLTIVKRTEADLSSYYWGPMVLVDVELVDGFFISLDSALNDNLSTCESRNHHMMFLGDSITAGYAVDSTPNSDDPKENVQHSWATLVANHYQSAYHVLASSGKWLSRLDGVENALAFYLNRTLKEDSYPEWNADLYVPDNIFIMLGTNDYWSNDSVDDDMFILDYLGLLRSLWLEYPSIYPHLHISYFVADVNTNLLRCMKAPILFSDADVYLLCGVMTPNQCCVNVQTVVTIANTAYDISTPRYSYVDLEGLLVRGTGDISNLMGHPTAEGHLKIAEKVIQCFDAVQSGYGERPACGTSSNLLQ